MTISRSLQSRLRSFSIPKARSHSARQASTRAKILSRRLVRRLKTLRRGERGSGRAGDRGTEGQRDRGTEGQRDRGTEGFFAENLSVPLSLCPSVSLSV